MADESEQMKISPAGVVVKTGTMIRGVYRGIFRDGAVARFGVQGRDELADALKAFPDTVQAQTDELYPTTPSQHAADQRAKQKGVHGKQERRSPSQIAKDSREQQAKQPQQSLEHDKSRTQDREHGMER